jgi:phage terminase small subunit
MGRGGYRPGAGRPKGAKSKIEAGEHVQPGLPDLLAALPGDIVRDAATKRLSPLEYMLQVMNDPNIDSSRRDRMAVAAAPFIHARKGEGEAKKKDKDERAKTASYGKFKPSPPPLRMVK